MKSRMTVLGALAVAAASTLAGAPAQAESKPMFARGIGVNPAIQHQSGLPNWQDTWTYNGQTYKAVFVGTNPSNGAATTVPVYVIPVQMKYSTTKFSPLSKLPGGQTVLANTLASPIFSTTVDFKQAGFDLGATQYIDAYTRGDFYGSVKNNTGYHVLLGTPTVEKLFKATVPAASGSVGTEFGVKVILADINWFDTNVVQKELTALKIPSNALAIFVTTQTYLTSGGCCIGGYHSVSNSGTTYAHFTYIQKVGAFSQDVSALSHEIGEWQLDPFTNNTSSPCGGLLENGDPLEREANYGDFSVVSNGFTYHLQDLVDLTYFGGPASQTAGGDITFLGTKVGICANGQ